MLQLNNGIISGETLANVYLNLSSSNNLFYYFLNDNVGIVGDSVVSDFSESWTIYYEQYYKPYADKLRFGINELQNEVIDKLFNNQDIEQLIHNFTFEIRKSGTGGVSFTVDTKDNFKSLNFINKYNENDSGFGYIKLNDNGIASKYISDILLGKHQYTNLYQHFNIDQIEIPSAAILTSSLFDSTKDATMVFWTKIPSGETYNDNGLFSIKNEKTGEEIYFEDDEFGCITKSKAKL